MKTRHRIPSIFNLSMVDVLCCALGCVILLWLLYFREAKQRTEAAGRIGDVLVQTEKDLKASRLELASLRDSVSATEKREQLTAGELQKTLREKDQLQQLVHIRLEDFEVAKLALSRLQALLEMHQDELRDLKVRELTLSTNAELKAKEAVGLGVKMTAALKTIGILEKQLQEKQTLAGATAKQAEDLAIRLENAESQIKKLEKDAIALLQERRDQGAKVDLAAARAAALEKELDRSRQGLLSADKKQDELQKWAKKLEALLAVRDTELNQTHTRVLGLEGETRILANQVRAAESRFAGIELTGERVLFLVDWSGSMRKKDNDIDDPEKWPMVCETVGKLMASLPALKKFQVLLFSDDWSYPLAANRRWLDYQGAASVKATVEALKRRPPQGGTNMAGVFQEAFTGFKNDGLDTIYVFSDGLPNAGAGLPPNSDNLKETERNALCSSWLRQSLKNWNTAALGRPRVRINTIGFYFDSPEVGAFLWVLAREHDGSFVGMSRP